MSLDVLIIEVHEKMKGFVWQREKIEGSMVEGYIVYQPLYYTSYYIKQINDTKYNGLGRGHIPNQ